jgi:hypothetical protein
MNLEVLLQVAEPMAQHQKIEKGITYGWGVGTPTSYTPFLGVKMSI